MKTIDDNYGPNEYTEIDEESLGYWGLTEDMFYALSTKEKREILIDMGLPLDTAY